MDISASKPIVPFRETIVKAPGMAAKTFLIIDMVALKDSTAGRGTATIMSPNGDVTIRVRTRPLPRTVTEFLLRYAESMKHFLLDRRASAEEDMELTTERVTMEKELTRTEFKKELDEICTAEGGEWKGVVDRSSS